MRHAGLICWWLSILGGGLAACDDEDAVNHVTPGPPAPAVDVGADVGGEQEAAAPVFSGVAVEVGVLLGSISTADVLGQRVLELLATSCSSCHSDQDRPGGVGALTDMTQLVELGLIVPGSSATSPLFKAIQSGRMPPQDDRYLPGPSVGEAALIARFIDGWAEVQGCDAEPFVSIDQALAAMAANNAVLASEDRPFARYATLLDASNAGLCGPALERQRQALFEAVNSASTGPDIVVPQAIDEKALIYRLDMRNYRWDRPIDLNGDGVQDFPDGWAGAVAAVGAYAIEYTGPNADALKAAIGAPVPVLSAQALVHAVSAGDLYYELIRVKQVIEDTRLELGIDILADLDAGRVVLAGFGRRGREVRVARYTQDVEERAWWSIDDQYSGNSESPFDNPLDVSEERPQFIFRLPNQLQAYAAQDDNGVRSSAVTQHEDCRERACATVSLAACHGCHGGGLLPIEDAVRAIVEKYPNVYDPTTLDQTEALYPLAAELDDLIESDGNIHRAALARALVSAGDPNPLSSVYSQFELAPLTARRAAGELGVPLDVLLQNLERLDPRLALLESNGSIDRATFTTVFNEAVCVLHAADQNRPLACP